MTNAAMPEPMFIDELGDPSLCEACGTNDCWCVQCGAPCSHDCDGPEHECESRHQQKARVSGERDTIPCPPPTFEEDEKWFEAEKVRLDARPRFSTGRLWKHAVAMTCVSCGHDFLADSTDLRPEMCPECGE